MSVRMFLLVIPDRFLVDALVLSIGPIFGANNSVEFVRCVSFFGHQVVFRMVN